MKKNKKYVVVGALLAVLAVVFGLAGTSAPTSEMISSQLSSDSVTHFMNPPTYDSGWVDIRDKAGQYITLRHGLNTTEVVVDITGRQSLDPQGGALAWNRTYGGADFDGAVSLIQTGDGGYAMAGDTDSFGAGIDDFWLVKTNSTGNKEWNKTYGGTDEDWAYSVVQTLDGGYAITGYTYSYGAGNADFWLVKTDQAGNMQWNKTYGTVWDEVAYSMVQTSDGYAMTGYRSAFGKVDILLVKTDQAGNMQWNKTYGDSMIATTMVQAGDGGYALAGRKYMADGWDWLLVKTDQAGNMQWNKTYGGTHLDVAYSVVQTLDGGYAITGYTDPSGLASYDFLLAKTDQAGNMQWNKTYGGANNDWAFSMVQTGDGGYALAGTTESFGAGPSDYWLVKTDQAGNMQWNKTYGGASSEQGTTMVQTSDGGYALAGFTASYGVGSADFWLVKVHVEMNLEHQRNFGGTSDEIGLAWTDLTDYTIILYRGRNDPYWNYVRVRVWTIEEPTWQFGDINQDGKVDAQDLFILSKNYGKTFSLLSLTGILAIAGVHVYKKRKEPK